MNFKHQRKRLQRIIAEKFELEILIHSFDCRYKRAQVIYKLFRVNVVVSISLSDKLLVIEDEMQKKKG